MSSAAVTDRVFAANRTIGHVALSVQSLAEATRRARVREEGALRVRCPGAPGDELEAVLVNTAGGMAGGDRFGVDIDVGRDARLVVTTAAAEKIYRSLGPETAVSIKMSVADSGTLAWLPQETILFDRARLRRTIDVELGGEATLVLAESLIFGRSGMGETMADGLLFDRWRIRRDGLLAYAETVRLDGAPARKLAVPAVANGGVAAGTILLAPGTDVVVGAVRALDFRGEVGASAWNGLAAVRFVATDGATLRHDMVAALAAIRALPRSWLT